MVEKIASTYATWRNDRYDRKKRPVVMVDVPVVSVGNLSTGGTGKTPFVQMLARFLVKQGRMPAIVMRGYKRRGKGLVVVHDGTKILADVAEAGDEAYMHAKNLGIPIVVSTSKVEAAVFAAGYLPCDVIIVDDGFQHRALHRDVDIVLFDDASAKGRMLPIGRLREPVIGLKRAHVVVGEPVPTSIKFAGLNSNVKHVLGDTSQVGTIVPKSNIYLPVSGIANPNRFFNDLKTVLVGRTLLEPIVFKDHKRYSAKDVDKVIEKAVATNSNVITTEKDAVKLMKFADKFNVAKVPLLAQPLRLELSANKNVVEQLIISRINDADRHIESLR